jgi:hypothetical protein
VWRVGQVLSLVVITWFGTHIIVHGSKRSNFKEITFKSKIKLLVLMKNLAKQLVLITNGILKLNDSQKRPSGDRSSLTSKSEMFLEDLPMRQRLVKLPCLQLTFSSSFELEESSLEKSKLLRAAHARDLIF